MKKFYSKPTAQLVDFSLSTSIAGNCGPGAGQDNNGWDAYMFANGCVYNVGNSEFCKDVPTADTSVFNS